MTRSDNRSGRNNLHLEKATELWCADIRRVVGGKTVRYRKRSKERREVEQWLMETERRLGN